MNINGCLLGRGLAGSGKEKREYGRAGYDLSTLCTGVKIYKETHF
jgi:hypothetical protein